MTRSIAFSWSKPNHLEQRKSDWPLWSIPVANEDAKFKKIKKVVIASVARQPSIDLGCRATLAMTEFFSHLEVVWVYIPLANEDVKFKNIKEKLSSPRRRGSRCHYIDIKKC